MSWTMAEVLAYALAHKIPVHVVMRQIAAGTPYLVPEEEPLRDPAPYVYTRHPFGKIRVGWPLLRQYRGAQFDPRPGFDPEEEHYR